MTRPPAAAQPIKPRRTVRRRHWPVHLILSLGAVLMAFPFVWEVLTAFKTYSASRAVPAVFWPDPWVWNFSEVLDRIPVAGMTWNSILLSLGRTVGHVLLCTLPGYGFARLRFPGRDILFVLLLSGLMIPSQLLLLPQFEIIGKLGLLNSLPGVILPGLFGVFGTFLMRQFYLTIPNELDEAARLDGANPWQIFWHVMLPLVRPAIMALSIFVVLWSWNDLLWPLVVISDQKVMPLAVGVALLGSDQYNNTNYPVLMSAAVLAMLPMLLAFLLLQRQFIAGLAFTGSRG